MNISDYVFLKIYRFINRIRNESSNETKYSAFLYLSFYLALIFVSIVCISGLIAENYISMLFKENSLAGFIGLLILAPIILMYRYYKRKSIQDIELKYNSIGRRLRIFMDSVSIILLISIPIISFVSYRLYVVEIEKWW